MNTQSNQAAQKENEKPPENKPKDMEICDWNGRKFKIAVLEKTQQVQENIDKQFNELRKQINKQNEYFTKETNFKKNQILETKNSIKKMRIS